MSHLDDYDLLEAVLDGAQEVDQKGRSGRTALQVAIGNGEGWEDMEKFTKVLNLGANVNLTDDKEETAAHYAAENDCVEYLALVLARGADPCAKTEDEQSILEVAPSWANTADMQELLEKAERGEPWASLKEMKLSDEVETLQHRNQRLSREVECHHELMNSFLDKQKDSAATPEGSQLADPLPKFPLKEEPDVPEHPGVISSNPKCCVCLEAPANCVVVPCGHYCLCSGQCQNRVVGSGNQCPVCKAKFTSVIKVFAV